MACGRLNHNGVGRPQLRQAQIHGGEMTQNFDLKEWNRNMIDEFRANAGKVNQFDQVLLLTTTGRRSGRPYTTPVVYAQDGGRYLIFASKAGADPNPARVSHPRPPPPRAA